MAPPQDATIAALIAKIETLTDTVARLERKIDPPQEIGFVRLSEAEDYLNLSRRSLNERILDGRYSQGWVVEDRRSPGKTSPRWFVHVERAREAEETPARLRAV